jgi:type II secretory pathway component PulC
MSKKGKTYILLAVVLGIWGTIGYQIFIKFSPVETSIVATNSDVNFTPKKVIEEDTFSINSEHRDPFLGKPYRQKQVSKTKKSTTAKKDSIVFPSIAYKGVISKQQSSQNIYIISINGQQQLFKVGKTIQDLKLLKGNKKSVIVSFKGKRKTIDVT